uniref:Uncharacterized protein n=1 Tax=Seriola lalandi dorsalis TaxID=1841481 RepID=A0A3B4X248_SERLL
MKLKEIKRTAIQSWSPAQHHPIYLATGMSTKQAPAQACCCCCCFNRTIISLDFHSFISCLFLCEVYICTKADLQLMDNVIISQSADYFPGFIKHQKTVKRAHYNVLQPEVI